MVGWVASLGLLLAVVHVPLTSSEGRVGWNAAGSSEQVALQTVQPPQSAEQTAPTIEEAPPPTPSSASNQSASDTPPETRPADSRSTESADGRSGDSLVTTPSSEAQYVSSLNAEDPAPEIMGGKGALYLHINYPKEAREQGVEGQLTLEFTVTTDGEAKAVEVVKSLHPLCDSAAVEGIQSVRFAPAKHNGTPIPVRMRLPVRFRLLSAAADIESE